MNLKKTVLYEHLTRVNDELLVGDSDIPALLKLFFTLIVGCVVILCFPVYLILYIIKAIYDFWYIKTEARREKKLEKERLKILNDIPLYMDTYAESVEKTFGFLHLAHAIPAYNEKRLKNFIYDFFVKYNIRYDTLTKDGVTHCDINRRRTLTDIYLISKTYFPKCTIKEVFNILIDLYNEKKISVSKCGTINQYVFYLCSWSEYDNLIKPVEYFPEHNITMKQLIDKYYDGVLLPKFKQNEQQRMFNQDMGVRVGTRPGMISHDWF